MPTLTNNTIDTAPVDNCILTAKDFASDQTVRWCPGCGDYSIIKQVQSTLADVGVPKENVVFVSGIGCSSRFPYYMNTYGMHSIHGRATAIASGLKAARPDSDVWVITGDGDSLAIGGNHLIHLLRRNFNVNVLLFNNEIYGLTKGQYSPTSPKGKVSKTSPMGTIDSPFDPASLALGADGAFIARALDRNPKHLKDVLLAAHNHKGTSFVEIYQNCVVFNHENFNQYSDKSSKDERTLYLEHDKPLVFGENQNKVIILNGLKPETATFDPEKGLPENAWIHDKHDKIKATILAQFFGPKSQGNLPRPFGILYDEERPTYEEELELQIQDALDKDPDQTLESLLAGNNHWEIN
jgi:2-oxoglutarate ferredoxin oxidoreductase subunit beta